MLVAVGKQVFHTADFRIPARVQKPALRVRVVSRDPRAREEWEGLRDRLLSIYVAANEDPDGFRATSRYMVATALRR